MVSWTSGTLPARRAARHMISSTALPNVTLTRAPRVSLVWVAMSSVALPSSMASGIMARKEVEKMRAGERALNQNMIPSGRKRRRKLREEE